MPTRTDELRTTKVDTLPTPAEVEAGAPLCEFVAQHVASSRKQVEAILSGKDTRLLVIVGPCSIHDTQAGLEYASRLKKLADDLQDSLFIVMRTYFEKPRTVVGWKGLINDPHLDGTCHLREGLFKARQFLLDVNKLGMPTATEFLDMVTGQYIADLISWGAIGARTTESQIHREMASALSCPVGFKNGTDGNIKIAIDAIRSSQTSHLFCSPDKAGTMTIYRTAGNPSGHIILRGGNLPNYDAASIKSAAEQLQAVNLTPKLIVDFSHANCNKEYERQLEVAKDICQQIINGDAYIAGIMAESFLEAGNQTVTDENRHALIYGQSITDPCLDWENTESMLLALAKAVAKRNNNNAI